LIPIQDKKRDFRVIILVVSLGLIALIISYELLDSYFRGQNIIGQSLVDSEFPSPSISPFYLKPATWLMFLMIISWYFILQLSKDKIRKLSANYASIVSAAFLVITIMSFYEMLYNFMLWSVILSHQDPSSLNPDKAINTFPSDAYKVNLVFATKIAVTIFGSAIYGFYMVRESRKEGTVHN
jgi:O-antigen ligase